MTDVAIRQRPRLVHALLRGVGWLFIGVGSFLLLYLVWLLWFTGVETAQVQEQLLEDFEGFAEVGPGDAIGDGLAGEDPEDDGEPEEVSVGDGFAVLEFERPGTDERPVRDDPVVVVNGTGTDPLKRGPGHYVHTAGLGEVGNVAIAGHRTTYGAPFYNLDQIRPGDLIHLTGRDGTRHTYEVLPGSRGDVADGQHVVSPGETWVIGDAPFGEGRRLLTLTTCHPRFSATFRMVVFAELVA